MKLTLPNACSQYGAQMGRPNIFPEYSVYDVQPMVHKLQLQRLRFVDLAYDTGGAYWGMPANLYCAFNPDFRVFVRAASRKEAKEKVRTIASNAGFEAPVRFYR